MVAYHVRIEGFRLRQKPTNEKGLIMEATKGKHRIRIELDDRPEDPREWENMGRMFCWHSRHILGDEQPEADPAEWLENYEKHYPGAVILPLYLYDHSGITMSTASFSCGWDSGQVGWIVCSPKYWEGLAREQVEKNLEGEIEVYDNFLTGSVYYFVTEVYREESEACPMCKRSDPGSWELVDSCGGFYGYDPKENGMIEHLEDEYKELLDLI